jgi:hypothetical protein
MRLRPSRRTLWTLALAAFPVCLSVVAQTADDPGWPRLFKRDGKQLTVYQPQVDYWKDYSSIHFRCAIAVKGVAKQERFGVAEIDATTVVDQAARVVALVPTQRELRFPNTSEPELSALRAAVDALKPPGQAMTLALDRVLAYVDAAEQPQQRAVEVSLDPPRIFSSRQPAILIILLGEPQFKPVEANRTDLTFALNTNWDLFCDTASQRYYLLNQDTWLTAPDVRGPWAAAGTLPAAFSSLPANDNWSDVRQNLPGKRAKTVPLVFVSTEPAELIVSDGDVKFNPIKGAKLLRVANTDSVLFLHSGEKQYYFLVAGRWFRAPSLDGPWSAASRDLPADFAQIPDSDPAAFVKASVPGTREAQDAVLLASIPATTEVEMSGTTTVQVVYEGQPVFKPIESTTVQYAVNTPYSVFLVSGSYYCCDAGIWFVSTTPAGPWGFCTTVPPAIYAIPASNPMHNVTYVVVQSSTPTTVVYSQTSGYSGEYVAATGVLMFGAGMLLGAALAHDHDDHYYGHYPPYPAHYSYGCGAVYHHGHGGYYYRGGAAYGPYGGAGYATAYNPATGTYARGASAYGPRGSASVKTAYNPYTGAYARTGTVNTAYGSASRGAAYNPYTGTAAAGRSVSTANGTASQGAAYNAKTGARAAGGQVSTDQGSAGRGAAYNPSTGNAAKGGYVSGEHGTVAGGKTNQGSAGVAWDTENGQGAVVKTKSGDVYAGSDGTVYKKDSDGNWSQNSGSGWESASKPRPETAGGAASASTREAPAATAQPANAAGTTKAESRAAPSTAATADRQAPAAAGQRATSAAGAAPSATSAAGSSSRGRQSLDSQAQARSWGNTQSQKSQSWKGSGSSSRSGGSSSRSSRSSSRR